MKTIQKLVPVAFLLAGAIFFGPKLASAIAEQLSVHDGVESKFESEHYTIVSGSVSDGGTFRVSDGARELKIRLCGVGVPENDPLLATASLDLLQELIDKGAGSIVLVAVGTELADDDAMVAEAFIRLPDSEEEIHLNSQLVAKGLARVDPFEIASCPNGLRIEQAEKEAKEQLLGLWADDTTDEL